VAVVVVLMIINRLASAGLVEVVLEQVMQMQQMQPQIQAAVEVV
jgi:hypothetical protein